MKNRFIIFLLLLSLSVLLISCSDNEEVIIGDDNMAVLEYPDLPMTGNDKNSWEYIEAGTDHKITWYVDVSSWPAPTGIDIISQKIKEITGITIEFQTPVTDDGQNLATMIAGGDLPDIITVTTSKQQVLTELARQGIVYDINGLADRWAPSLYNNFPTDVMKWWEFGNNKTYGIPNHYYSYDDVPIDEQLQPNGGMMVRKDIFNAWQNHAKNSLANSNGLINYTSISGKAKSVPWQGFITTPEGFKQAALWALDNYKSSLTTGLQLSQFKSDGNSSIDLLAQFFAIPFEDENGNYIYHFTERAYEEMLYYLNDLYNSGIISTANFTHDYDGVGSVIAGGKAFATLAIPQDYQMHFVTAKDLGYEYISTYITNEEGDAPVLSDIRGYGYFFNMITTKAKRPDLLIKLFDFLSSHEGQRLVTLGPEGLTWNWKDNNKDEIIFTEQYLIDKANKEETKYSLLRNDMLINWQYYDNIQPKINHGKSEADLFRTNLKRPLTIYSHDTNALRFIIDASDERFQTYNNNLTRINQMIGTQLPKIIKASNKTKAIEEYDKTISALNSRGLELVISMNAEAYLKAKQKLGITVAWPPYQQGYNIVPNRLEPNGDLSKYRGY